MEKWKTIKWSFLILCGTAVLLAGGVGRSSLNCHGVSLLVPEGGEARVVSPTRGLTATGERPNLFIYNSYLHRHYRGGKSFDWSVNSGEPQSFEVLLEGRLGGKIQKTIQSAPLTPNHPNTLLAVLNLPEDIVGGDGATAELVPPDLAPNQFDSIEAGSLLPVPAVFPITCPRLASTRYLFGKRSGIPANVVTDPNQDWYEGTLDSKNQPPDDIRQNGWSWNFDCRNVLCINKATASFDWEDERIVIGTDRSGNDVTEAGAGGLYANFHYAAVPCNDAYRQMHQNFLNGLPSRDPITASQLMRCANHVGCSEGEAKHDAYRAMQDLLRLAQGEGSFTPSLKAHGMLPGPFLSKTAQSNEGYDQCEWLDTRHHAPRQSVNYRNFCIWDWDNDPAPADQQCVMVLLWEGDGASTGIARRNNFIGPDDVGDDFIGFFEVRRRDTVNASLAISNYSNHLTLEWMTGDAACR